MRKKIWVTLSVVGVPRTIDGEVRRWMRRGGLATHHRRENNTTGGARQTHHALSMAEKHDRGGAADSPCTIDERKIRRVGRGGIATHHRRESNTTGGAQGGRRAPSKGANKAGEGVGGQPQKRRPHRRLPLQ